VAVTSLQDKTTGNYDTAFAQYRAWAIAHGYYYVTPDRLNDYLARVCFYKPTDFHARNIRAAVDLLADIRGVPRPINRLTGRLVLAATKAYRQGATPLPQTSRLLPFLLSAPRDLVHAVFAVLCCSGFRPSDLDRLSLACWDFGRGILWTRSSKGFPVGRNAFVPPVLLPHLSFLASRFPGLWWSNTASARDRLVFFARSILAADPNRLPGFTLRAARHWLATHLYSIGAPSPYIMRQLGHKWWATSQVYIHTVDDLPAPWRGVCTVLEGNRKWVHPEAFNLIFHDPVKLQQWISVWRSSFACAPAPELESDSDSDAPVVD